MATTSTSINTEPACYILLVSTDDNSQLEIDLSPNSHIDPYDLGVASLVVSAYGSYEMYLCFRPGWEYVNCYIEFNGQRQFVNCSETHSEGTILRNNHRYYKVSVDTTECYNHPFSLIYGFVQFELQCYDLTLTPQAKYVSGLVPCTVNDDEQASQIENIIKTLIDADDFGIMDLMLQQDVSATDKFSIIKASGGACAPKSLKEALRLIANILDVYQEHLPYFRTNAVSSLKKKQVSVKPNKVRKMGSNEVVWMGRHPDKLFEVKRHSAIKQGRKNYYPSQVLTTKTVKTRQNLENELILSFLSELVVVLHEKVGDINRLHDVHKANLEMCETLGCNRQTLPIISVLEASSTHVERLLVDASMLYKRAVRLLNTYKSIFSGVKYSDRINKRMLVRTKTFQEIRAYSEIYQLAVKWVETSDFNLNHEDFLMHIYSLDKLYEYYVLYQLLVSIKSIVKANSFNNTVYDFDWLNTTDDIEAKLVNNTYVFNTNNLIVELYYQPVFYGDNTELNGIDIHRITNTYLFSDRVGDTNYYTPDYLLRITDLSTNKTSTHVLDAKYRNLKARGNKDVVDTFRQCFIKYKCEVASATSQDPVDSVWLVYGRGNYKGLHKYATSTWAQDNLDTVQSGVVTCHPDLNDLDSLIRYFFEVDFGYVLDDVEDLQQDVVDTTSSKDNLEDTLDKDVSVEDTDEVVEEVTVTDDLEEASVDDTSDLDSTDTTVIVDEVNIDDSDKSVVAFSKVGEVDIQNDVVVHTIDAVDLLNSDEEDIEAFRASVAKANAGSDKPSALFINLDSLKDNLASDSSKEESDTRPTCEVEDSPKPKSKKKQKPNKKKGKKDNTQVLSKDIINAVKFLWRTSKKRDFLFSSKFARHELNLTCPLLKDKVTTRYEKNRYKPIELDGRKYFVFTRFMPHQLASLDAFIEKSIDSIEKIKDKNKKEQQDDILSVIGDIYNLIGSKEDLFTDGWSGHFLKLNSPLLRNTVPNKRELKKYKQIQLDDKTVYAYIDFLPHQKNMLYKLRSKMQQS